MPAGGVAKMWHGEREREVYELYSEDLLRLTFNSKPVISNLTELAHEYSRDFAPLIVKIIEERIRKVPPDQKLPHVYLMDSIIKNHTDPYCALFQQNIVSLFGHVFEYSRESVRESLHKLRNTWHDFFAFPKLNQLDKHVNKLDKNWPIQAPRSSRSAARRHHQQPQAAPAAAAVVTAAAPRPTPTQVHLNPNFLRGAGSGASSSSNAALDELKKKEMELQMLKKQKEELALMIKQQEIDRELEEARKQVEQQKALIMNVGQAAPPPAAKAAGSADTSTSNKGLATAAAAAVTNSSSSSKQVPIMHHATTVFAKKVRCPKSIYLIQKFTLSSTTTTTFPSPSKYVIAAA